MNLLYPFILFFLVPLFFLHKRSKRLEQQDRERQKNLLYMTLLFMLVALSRPVIPNALEEQNVDGKDYIIALDASFSMQANDLLPTRYEVAKENINKIIQGLKRDRFSIFAFTTNTMLISPPTTDSAISMQALDSLEPKYILTKGTSLLELFKTVAKTSYASKEVIIFSDGGEDQNLARLVSLCKTNNIVPFIVATASSSGSTLIKEDKLILDDKKNLVISRENPLLKPLASECGGEYYQLQSNRDISQTIMKDLKNRGNDIRIKTQIRSYKELFYIPLFFAFVTFFLAVTKLHQLSIFIPLLLLPHPSDASILFDFYHNAKAESTYEHQDFLYSAKEFQSLSPSVESYYNIGVAYYRAKAYKQAMQYFSQIKTPNRVLKQKLFYNMGNVAIKLKRYRLAITYYKKSLALGDDKDALFNLSLLYKLAPKEQEDISKMLAHKKRKKKKEEGKKQEKSKESKQTKKSSSGANQKASQKSAGSGSNKKRKKKENENLQLVKKRNKSKYKLGYHAYELINKGYTNETHPW